MTLGPRRPRVALRERERPLFYWHARRCELGEGVRCGCRCAGTLHGQRRFGAKATRDDFVTLPPDDLHHVARRAHLKAIRLPFEDLAP